MIYKKKELCPPDDEFINKLILQNLKPMYINKDVMKYDIYQGQTLVLSLQKRKTEQGIIWEHIYDEMENESEMQALIDALAANPDLKRWKQYTIFAFYTCSHLPTGNQ